MKKLLLLSLASFSFLFASEARAQGTPDFMTPSAESVCDGYEDKAWGLCNAYCEAMDCELANDNDPATNPKASAQACAKVASKFDEHSGGQQLPCEVPDCPCLAYDGFVSALNAANGNDVYYCADVPEALITEGWGGWGVGIWSLGDIGVCGWYNWSAGYGVAHAVITTEELTACQDAIRPALYAQGACGG